MIWQAVVDTLSGSEPKKPEYSDFRHSDRPYWDYSLAIYQYYSVVKTLDAKIKCAMLREAGIAGHPRADLAWQQAYHHGYRQGWHAVYDQLAELAKLMR